MKLTLNKPDTFGALASSLCLIHCIATPILFIAQASSACCSSSVVPSWWQAIDYLFLIISFFAIHGSTQTTTKKYMKPALWLNWLVLFLVVVNEKLALIYLPETFIYTPALTLVALHLYNLKYCQCKTDNCCTNHE